MYDPFLVARLSDRGWRLLGTLLLTRQQSTVFKRRELMERSGLTKNNLNLARNELVEKGLIAVLSLGDKGIEYTIINQQGEAGWEAIEIPTPALRQGNERLAIAAPKDKGDTDAASRLIREYAERFKDAPLNIYKARDMLKAAGNDLPFILSVFDRVSKLKDIKDIKVPKAYILKILKEEVPAIAVETEQVEVDPVFYELVKRRRKHAHEKT